MSDKEFIEFLWNLLIGDLTDGDTPSDEDWETLIKEGNKRSLEIDV